LLAFATVSDRFAPFRAVYGTVFCPFFTRFSPVFARLFSPSLSEEFFWASAQGGTQWKLVIQMVVGN
jgi:hypothetical protein